MSARPPRPAAPWCLATAADRHSPWSLTTPARGAGPPGGRRVRYAEPVDASHRESAERVRSQIEQGLREPSRFRAALASVPPAARDSWVDCALGLGAPP